MFVCCLCDKNAGGNLKGIQLTKEISENLTFLEALKQQIPGFFCQITDSTCASCFNIFKSFYQLIERVKNNFNPQLEVDAGSVKNNDPPSEDSTSITTTPSTETQLFKTPQFSLISTQPVFLEIQPTNRRKHPSNDSENERKIREFIDVKCHLCELKFDSFSKVKKHFKSCHSEQSGFLVCCDKKFTKRSTLLDHIEFHDKTVVHRCEICNKEYKNKANLRTHNRITHSNFYQKCICSKCGKICKNEITMKIHMKSHEIDLLKSFECFICHRDNFKNFHLLRSHLRTSHTQSSSIICDICSAVIKSRYFRNHMKTHQLNREKFQCEICQRWILKQSRSNHMKKHTDLGVNCEICGKFLKDSSYLPTHIKITHSDNHRHHCEFCEKSFHKKVKLMEHVAARHTREILFKCRVEGCEKEFRSEGNWKIHEKKIHPNEYEKYFKPSYLRAPGEEGGV